MIARTSDVRTLLTRIRTAAISLPAPQLIELAQESDRLDPSELGERAETLLAEGAPAGTLARLVIAALEALASDIDEHGDHAEYVDEEDTIQHLLSSWRLRVDALAPEELAIERALLADDLEDAVVVGVEYMKILSESETTGWAALRAAKRLIEAAMPLAETPPSPWFVEIMAAYFARELKSIAKANRRTDAYQSCLDDAPAMLAVLRKAASVAGWPAVFGGRVLHYARMAAEKHGHAEALRAVDGFEGGPRG